MGVCDRCNGEHSPDEECYRFWSRQWNAAITARMEDRTVRETLEAQIRDAEKVVEAYRNAVDGIHPTQYPCWPDLLAKGLVNKARFAERDYRDRYHGKDDADGE